MLRAISDQARIELVEGDVTAQHTDAIVNAAHPDLLGGQGVDGAVHAKGGPEILAACRQIRGCPIGCAVITTGGKLKARFVIHAVGPMYTRERNDSSLLRSAYHNSLRIAAAYGLQSVSFPAISTGAFDYPMRDAAAIAMQTAVRFLRDEEHSLELVRFVLYPREHPLAHSIFADALTRLLDGSPFTDRATQSNAPESANRKSI